MGLVDSGTSVSLSSHRIFSAEAEFSVRLSSSLEPRDTLYSEAEVWAAVGTVASRVTAGCWDYVIL